MDKSEGRGQASSAAKTGPPKAAMEKLAKFLPVIGLLVFIYIIWRVGLASVVRAFGGANFLYLVLTPPFIFAIILLKGLKWKLILDAHNMGIPYRSACLIWAIGSFAGNLTPAQAGEAIKVLYLRQRRPEVSAGRGLSTVAMDKILELTSLGILGLLSVAWLIFRWREPIPFLPIVISGAIVFGGVYVVTNRGLVTKMGGLLANPLLPVRYREGLRLNFDQFFGGIETLLKERKRLLLLLLLTIATWFVAFLHLFTLTLVLRLGIPISYAFTVFPIIVLVATLPISIAGLGTRDAAAVFFFSLVGIASGAAVSWSVLALVTQSWAFVLIGWLLMLRYPAKVETGRQDRL